MSFPRLVIAGTHSGVGKATVTLALLSAFRAQGRTIQPFKVGSEFLDPGHHQLASGRESRNLDGWMLGALLNRTIFQEAAHGADLSIIEGMMGGVMYLVKTLSDFDGTVYDMVGVIPAETSMSRTQMTLGYRELTVTCAGPLGEQGVRIRGHEFHYSTLHPKGELKYLGHLTDAQGRDRGGDGITVGTVIALYTHLHFSSHPHVPSALIEAARGETAMRGNRL